MNYFRFTNIDLSEDRVYIYMNGVPGEVVTMRFVFQGKGDDKPTIYDHKCTILPSAKNSIVFGMYDPTPTIYCQDA